MQTPFVISPLYSAHSTEKFCSWQRLTFVRVVHLFFLSFFFFFFFFYAATSSLFTRRLRSDGNKLWTHAVITATDTEDGMFEKAEKKERDVAPTRGQFPCPAFGPHGASLSFGFFLWIFFSPLFLFFLWSFFSGFSQSKRAISPALSVWTPSHMRTYPHRRQYRFTKKSAGVQEEKKKVCDADMILMWDEGKETRTERMHTSPLVSQFQTIAEWESGTRCKQRSDLLLMGSCVL